MHPFEPVSQPAVVGSHAVWAASGCHHVKVSCQHFIFIYIIGSIIDAGITIGSIQNVMGVLYSATNFQGMFNLMNVLPVVGYERSVFYRCVMIRAESPA